MGLLENCLLRYLNHKSNPRKEPTYKTPSEKEALILILFQTEQHLSCSLKTKKCLEFVSDVGVGWLCPGQMICEAK